MIVARLLSLSLTGTAVLLLSASGPVAEGAEKTTEACFRCNQNYNESAQWWEHWDAYFAVQHETISQGQFHSHDWTNCYAAISYAGHILYNTDEEFGGEALDRAVTNGSDDALLAVLTSSPNVEINLQRSALQIINGPTNEVVYHAKIPRSQLERLAGALADRNWSR